MKDPVKDIESALEGLGHHDVLDLRQSHSRNSAAPVGRPTLFKYLSTGLGLRRLREFGAVHHERLSALLAPVQKGPKDARTLAWRGRLRRLLGDAAGAADDYNAALALKEDSRAAGWLGELLVYEEPKKAQAVLAKAAALDPKWAWPHLWLGLAKYAPSSRDAARQEWDLFLKLSGSPVFTAHYLLFHLFFESRDYQTALREAQAAIKLDPLCPAGYDMAGQALHAAGDLTGAREQFHRARNHDMDVQGLYLFTSLGVRLDWTDPKGYLTSLDRAIESDGAQAVLFAERAEVKRDPRICLYEEALKDYAAAAELAPDCAWIRAVLGRAKNNLHGKRAGLEEFDKAIELCPDSGWMRAWRGAALARVGERENALKDFDRSEVLMPWHSFTYAWRGALYNRLGRYSEASSDLDTAIRLDPYYNFSFYERFQARAGLKDFLGAVEDLNHSFRADPKFTWLGNAPRNGMTNRLRAVRQLDEAIKKNPGQPWLHAWRGHTWQELGDGAKAAADLDKALKLDPASALLYAWRGAARAQLGRDEAAMKDLQKAVELDPGLWTAYRGLSELRSRRGELKEALAAITKVVEMVPTTVPCIMSKAMLEHQLGLNEEALRDLAKTIQLDPGYVEGYALTARIRLATGDVAGACENVDKALACPNPPGLVYLVRGLIRQQKGDLEGQIEDFKRAFEADPELFPESQRHAVRELIGFIGGKANG
jgi:tetratricopeptide (TPR) repeat protein